MQVVVKGKNMEVNERLKSFAEGKITKLSRVLPSIAEAEVEFSTEKTKSADSRFIAQVTLKSNGQLIRAEQSAADTHSALNVVIDKLDQQIRRYKSRRVPGKGGSEARAGAKKAAKGIAEEEATVEEATVDEDEHTGRLVRTKRFAMKPMDVDEALEQMELLGHDFYVFLNSETERVSVVYKRTDGDFGLIEPEKV